MRSKAVAALLLAAGMTLSLAACGSDTPAPKSPYEERMEESTQTPADDSTTTSSDSGSSYNSSSGGSSSDRGSYSTDDDGFEEYLKENDPDSYEFYQDLEEGWNSGEWDSENGFVGDDAYSGDDDFEDYLYDNDRDSYDSYQSLEDGWSSGSWDPENGFFQ